MTREEAIKELKEDIELYIPLHGTIDDVDRDLPDGRLITALEMGIKALEQTELSPSYNGVKSELEQTRWIPVSERLPEIHQDILMSLRSLDVVVGFRAKEEPYFYSRSVDGCYIEPQNVLAWQPLPLPYSESEGV